MVKALESVITVVPMPSGDFEARRGGLTARGATAAEAESNLMELLQLRWEDLHIPEKPPIVDEDHIVEPSPEGE